MNTYRVDMPNNTHKIIEAEYFALTTDNDVKSAHFYVDKAEEIPGGTVKTQVLVGYARNPLFIQFNDAYEVKPKPGTMRERMMTLDRNYDGL